MSGAQSKDQILAIAQEILGQDGLERVSFDAIARRWGRSKQAVLYWFPTKQALLSALFLPALTAEAEAVEVALSNADDETVAVAAFVKAVVGFHLSDLARFRMMYLAPQLTKAGSATTEVDVLDDIHKITDRTYSALASRLEHTPEASRQRAFAIHAACLGLVTMYGLADHLGDPLKHGAEVLTNALIASLTQR